MLVVFMVPLIGALALVLVAFLVSHLVSEWSAEIACSIYESSPNLFIFTVFINFELSWLLIIVTKLV